MPNTINSPDYDDALWALKQACDRYRLHCVELAQYLTEHDESKPAWYHTEGRTFTNHDARQFLANWLTKRTHEQASARYGFLAASPATQQLAHDYNFCGEEAAERYTALKNVIWREFVKGKRLTDPAYGKDTQRENVTTKLGREALEEIGHPDMDFVRIRAKAPIINAPLIKATWFYENKPNNLRKTMTDALDALYKLKDAAHEDYAAMLDKEIAELCRPPFDPQMPVAKTQGKPVKLSRVRAWYVTEPDRTIEQKRFSAALPLLCSDVNIQSVTIKLPSAQRNKGAGRKSAISETPVSPTLAKYGWFHYTHLSDTGSSSSTQGVSDLVGIGPKRKPRFNTEISGLKLIFRKEKALQKLYIQYRHNNKSSLTMVDLEKFGDSWQTAYERALALNDTLSQAGWNAAKPHLTEVQEWAEQSLARLND